MKKVYSLLMMMLCVATALGQTIQNSKRLFSVKPMAGVSVSTISGSTAGDVYHSIVRPTGGIELEYGATGWLGVSLGIFYSQLGAKANGKITGTAIGDGVNRYTDPMTLPNGAYGVIAEIDGHVYGDYLNFPLLANIYIPQVKGLAVKLGLQVGALVKDAMEYKMLGVVVDMKNSMSYPFNIATIKAQTDILKSADFGIPVGLSYEYKNVVLDARYYFGLSKIDNTVDADNVHNRYFSVTLGYRLRL